MENKQCVLLRCISILLCLSFLFIPQTFLYAKDSSLDITNNIVYPDTIEKLEEPFDFENLTYDEFPGICDNSIENDNVKLPFQFHLISDNLSTAKVKLDSTNLTYDFYLSPTGEKNSITISKENIFELIVDTEYSFCYKLFIDNEIVSYNGKLQAKYSQNDDKISNIIESNYIKINVYDFTSNSSYNQDLSKEFIETVLGDRGIDSLNEREYNNTYNYATETYDDYDNYGALNPSGDIDWWKISFSSAGNANFWLGNIPSGCDYDMQLYNSTGTYILSSSMLGGNNDELITWPIAANTVYYIKIYSYSGFSPSLYWFRAKNYPSTILPDPLEPNNYFNTATPLISNPTGWLEANIHTANDADYYKFYLSQNSNLYFILSNIPNGTYNIYIANNSQTIIQYSQGTPYSPAQINTTLSPGYYYIIILMISGSPSASNYRLDIATTLYENKAIVIIPGMAGSELWSNDHIKLMWANLTNLISANFPIKCTEGGLSFNNLIRYNDDNYGAFDVYQSLYSSLYLTYNGQYDVLFFPYDWRLSCSQAAVSLANDLVDYDKVILVAHSMGGLVASKYISNSTINKNKVEKLITIGTPYQGAPKAIHMMETGEFLGFPFDIITASIFKPIAQNLPAVYELLPSPQYDYQNYPVVSYYSSQYYNYGDTINFLKTLYWTKISGTSLTKPMLNNATNFHNSLIGINGHVANDPTNDVYKIITYSLDTILKIEYIGTNINRIIYGGGDGTVPFQSAVNDNLDNKTYIFTDINHTALVSDYSVINQVKEIINGTQRSYINDLNINEKGWDVNNINNKRINIIIRDFYYTNLLINSSNVYKEGQNLFIDSDNKKIHIGSIWYLENGAWQLALYNDNYNISFINNKNIIKSVEIGYIKDGYYDSIYLYDDISTNDNFDIYEFDTKNIKCIDDNNNEIIPTKIYTDDELMRIND